MSADDLHHTLNYISEHRASIIAEISSFVAIPSISTEVKAKPDLQRAAEWLVDRLKKLGAVNIDVVPTPGAPVVLADLAGIDPNAPTALIYGHYDVQPVEPLELWDSKPFEPEMRADYLFGRGVSDMKGQIVAVLAAIEACQKSGGLPINFKFIIEGEEEVGSPNLEKFIVEHKDRLKADFSINPDAGMIGRDFPTITYGLRGLAYFEIRLTGPDHDLHSGQFGGAVHNPGQVLCDLISGMHDRDGRVTLPGYYDRVRSLSDEERLELARLPMDEAFYLKQTGAPGLFGEKGYSYVEQVTARPTLEVNGLLTGFTGEGSKTVLPSKAMAKISMRLVPDQDPAEVHQQLIAYLKANVPPTVKWELLVHATGFSSITDRNNPAVIAMSKAMEDSWGKRTYFKREGGSIPVVATMQKHLGIESILTGFSCPEDNLHAPNERLHIPTFMRGIEALARLFHYLQAE